MIPIEEAAKNIGRGVYERPYCPREDGTITSVSTTTVFVRYRGDLTSKGTNPEDLTWLSEVAR